MKTLINTLPIDIRNFVLFSDNYTLDNEGYIYDPYWKEYPTQEDIIEQMEYQRLNF